MAIEFRCSQCNQLLRVPDDSAGKNARCPKCSALMQVPAQAAGFPGSAPVPLPVPPVAPASPAPAPLRPPEPAVNSLGFAPPAEPKPSPTTPAAPNPFASATALPTGANPFGEAGAAVKPGTNPFQPAAAGVNPYATPAYTGYSQPLAYVPRSGLPWEVSGRSVGTWFQTMQMVLGSPSRAFTVMRTSGGMGSPILFNFWGMGVPVALAMLLIVPFILFLVMLDGPNNGNPAAWGMGLGIAAGVIFGLAIYVVLAVTIGVLIAAGVMHLCLMIVGGARNGFEATFRVISFAQGAMGPLGVVLGCIPYLGGLIHVVWMVVILIIGVSKAHEISGGKAAAAVLLPTGFCFALSIAWVAFVLIMDANR